MPDELEKPLDDEMDDETAELDPDLLLADDAVVDDAVLDADEVDPFKDKWEE